MAEKLKQGDSLATEIFDKFNRLVDEVNGMEGGGSLTAEAIKDALGYTPVDNAGVSKLFSQLTTDIDNGLVQAGYAKNSDKLDGKDSSYYLDYNNLSNKPSGGGSGGSTGGGGDAIIDVNFLPGSPITKVNVLPTENIDKNIIYGAVKVNSFAGGYKNKMPDDCGTASYLNSVPITVHVVKTLPTVGEVATDNVNAPTRFVLYYKPGNPIFTTNDDRMYAYLDGEWVRAESFFEGKYFITYHSFVEKEEDIQYPDLYNHISFIISYDCYQYDGTAWKRLGEFDENATITTKSFYRVKESETVEAYSEYYGLKNVFEVYGANVPIIWHIVDELPQEGKDILDTSTMQINMYFNKIDNMVYSYVESMVPGMGWLDFYNFVPQILGIPSEEIGGIFSVDNMPEIDPEKLYVIYSYKGVYSLHHYKDGWHNVAGENNGNGNTSTNKQLVCLSTSLPNTLAGLRAVLNEDLLDIVIEEPISIKYWGSATEVFTIPGIRLKRCIPDPNSEAMNTLGVDNFYMGQYFTAKDLVTVNLITYTAAIGNGYRFSVELANYGEEGAYSTEVEMVRAFKVTLIKRG